MKTACWWCSTIADSTTSACPGCGAPADRIVSPQAGQQRSFWSKYQGIIAEFIIIVVCLSVVFSAYEDARRSANKTRTDESTAPKPAPQPSPTPTPRSSQRAGKRNFKAEQSTTGNTDPAVINSTVPSGNHSTGSSGQSSTYNSISTSSSSSTYTSPVRSSTVPSGATARCADGTYSYSQSRRGTCSHHGGVAEWLY